MCKKLKLLDSKGEVVTPFHSDIKGNETYASAMTYETPLTNAQMYVTAHLLVWHFCHFTWRRKGQVVMLQPYTIPFECYNYNRLFLLHVKVWEWQTTE